MFHTAERSDKCFNSEINFLTIFSKFSFGCRLKKIISRYYCPFQMQGLLRSFTALLVCSTFKSFCGDLRQAKLQNNEGCYGYRYGCLCYSSAPAFVISKSHWLSRCIFYRAFKILGHFKESQLSIFG